MCGVHQTVYMLGLMNNTINIHRMAACIYQPRIPYVHLGYVCVMVMILADVICLQSRLILNEGQGNPHTLLSCTSI